MEDVIITSFSNPTSEGVVLHLNKKASLKTGNMVSNEFWVSWDKIGEALIDGYTTKQEVSELRALRNAHSATRTTSPQYHFSYLMKQWGSFGTIEREAPIDVVLIHTCKNENETQSMGKICRQTGQVRTM